LTDGAPIALHWALSLTLNVSIPACCDLALRVLAKSLIKIMQFILAVNLPVSIWVGLLAAKVFTFILQKLVII
jgi:hypothetical protein